LTASPPGGTYNAVQSVILSSSEPAIIYYTLDGSNPSTTSSQYTSPISITSTSVLKFFAIDAAGNASVTKSEAYTINQPDLTVTALSSGTKSVKRGGSLKLSSTVKNQGTLASSSFVVQFAISTNSTIGDGDDILLTPQRTVSSLRVGQSSTASTTVTVPTSTPAGTYFVGALADFTKLISESREDNNTAVTAATITVR